jgi:hypothetical protein
MTTPALLNSRTIGETENALRAILTRTLAGTGLDYHRWVALKVVAESPAPVTASIAAARLTRGLKIDDAAAHGLLDDLQIRGIVMAADTGLALTTDGTALYQRLNGEVRRLSQQVFADLPVDDLVAAERVLSTITQRANAILGA